MLENGHIKLYRKFANWRWYKDANTMRLFVHLLLAANFENRDFESITIHRGEVVSSYPKLASELGLSIQNIRTAINHLKSTGEVTCTSYAKFTVIAINNYNEYQSLTQSPTDSQQASNRLPTGNQQQYKKDKKDKKDKEDITVNQVVDLYHEICKSYPKLRGISENRRKAITARCKIYRIEDFRIVFQNAENSRFLKGSNDRNWSANFDWMMKDTNFIKILEGRYNGGSNDTFAVSDSRGRAAADTTESANDGEGLI